MGKILLIPLGFDFTKRETASLQQCHLLKKGVIFLEFKSPDMACILMPSKHYLT
jgi:hypothetical protein